MIISDIIKKQRDYFHSGETKDWKLRRDLLKKLKSEILDHEEDIYQALYSDFQKPKVESYLSEFGIVISEINLAIKNIKKWSRVRRIWPSLLNFPSRDYIHYEPYGTVLIISPWNYPFQLAIAPIIMAIAAGNTVVLKPSELTPATSKLVETILTNVFNEQHVATVQGSVEVATELLSKQWDYIFFTGSVPVGKIVAKAAAQHLTPVTLELGGKSPCIIDDSVDIRLVVRRLVWGKFLNAGQTCIAPDYLIVNTKIKEELIQALIKKIERVYGENPELSEDFARVINSKNLKRLKGMLENEQILYGGIVNEETNYLSPTLVDEPSLDSALMGDEIFGPILPILGYDKEEDIEKIILNFSKPLSFYVFSKRKTFANNLIRKYSFGGGTINDTLIHFGNHRLPFGGVGDSGMGAYHGKLGFETFSHKKAIIRKANWLDLPVRYAPYKGKLKPLKQFFKWFA